MEKESLRESTLATRNRLSGKEVSVMSVDIEKNFFSLPFVHDAKAVMLFSSFGSEPDTSIIIEKLLKGGKKVLLPTTVPGSREIIPVFIDSRTRLVENKFGIMEPVATDENKASLPDIDVIVVPGLAFDLNGNRVGFGYCYYDGFLKQLRAKKIAFAFELQISNSIEPEVHDIPMDFVITEKRVIECRRD